jgi:hypothetical protein
LAKITLRGPLAAGLAITASKEWQSLLSETADRSMLVFTFAGLSSSIPPPFFRRSSSAQGHFGHALKSILNSTKVL